MKKVNLGSRTANLRAAYSDLKDGSRGHLPQG